MGNQCTANWSYSFLILRQKAISFSENLDELNGYSEYRSRRRIQYLYDGKDGITAGEEQSALICLGGQPTSGFQEAASGQQTGRHGSL